MTFDTPTLFASLAFRGWFPLWLAVVLAVLAGVGVLLLYASEAKRVPLPVRLTMAGLRGLILFGILFLILRPTWLLETRGDRPRPVVILVDDSQSMLTADLRSTPAERFRAAIAYGVVPPESPLPQSSDVPPGSPEKPSRLELAKQVLANQKLVLVETLKKLGPIQAMSFGSARTNKDVRDPAWPTTLTGSQPRTAIADTVFDLLNRDENERPAAVVLFTDGRENASSRSLDELARECARTGVPLHIYGIGSTVSGQLQLRDVPVQDTLFVEDNAAVPVRYRSKGFPGGKVEFSVTLNGKEVVNKTVEAKDGDDLRELLSFVPAKTDAQPGKQELKTTIKVTNGDQVLTDEVTKSVRIVDRKLRVLMVDSQPRWDFKFIQRALLRDRRVEAKFLLTDGDPRAMKTTEVFLPVFPVTRPELYEYDLLILGDLAATFFSKEQQEMIRDFVAEGRGLIHIAGKGYGPATWIGTPLADVLPVEFDAVKFVIDTGKRPEGFRPELTPSGIRALLLSLDDDPVESYRIWKELPEMYWHYPVRKVKPASEVYLVHPKETMPDNKPMPLLASHYYGKGYVLFSAVDETWRWRFNEAEKWFGRFWSQAIYLAGAPRSLGTKMTQLSLDNPDPSLGKTGQVYARLFNSDLKPLKTERIEARVERLDVDPNDAERSFPVELKAMPGQDGEYYATIPFNRVGKFILRVDNGGDQAALEYRVGLPNDHELSPGGLEEDAMAKLAEGSGGRFYREEGLHQLPASVKPQTSPFVQREEILLWNRWALFALIGLLTLEWFVRKFNSLS
jgi:uncharacterized membrane protein